MNATVWVSGAAVRRVALLATLVREHRGEVDTRDTASDPDVAVANPSCLMLDPNTELALERTRLALERTLMGWIRTSVSLVTFGFALDEGSRSRAPTRRGTCGSGSPATRSR